MVNDNYWLKYFITEELVLVNEPDISKAEVARKVDGPALPRDLNQKSLLVLVRADMDDILSEKNTLFLQKVLKAVNLSENEYVTVYLPAQWRDLPPEWYKMCPGKVILFHDLIKPEGLEDALYTVQHAGNVQWLLADNPGEIAKNTEKKKALWSALKKMFNVG